MAPAQEQSSSRSDLGFELEEFRRSTSELTHVTQSRSEEPRGDIAGEKGNREEDAMF